jgi:hypothetical protein
VVRERNDVHVGGHERQISGASSDGFEALSAFALELETVQGECDAAVCALLRAKACPRIGVG